MSFRTKKKIEIQSALNIKYTKNNEQKNTIF